MVWNLGGLFGSGGGVVHGGGAQPMALPTANPQQQLTSGVPGGTGGNPVSATPAVPAPPAPSPQDSLLETMGRMWQTPTTADGKPVAPAADPLRQQIHSFDPKAIADQAKTLDFTRSLTDEVLQKAATGDVAAMRQAFNEVAQQAFVGNTHTAATLINQGFDKYGRLVDAALPDRLKQYEIQNTRSEDPILSHASIQPLMAALKGVAANTKPGATAAEIQNTAEEYLKGFATLMASKQQATTQAASPEKEVDWLAYSGIAKS